jgi:hypothetical protein
VSTEQQQVEATKVVVLVNNRPVELPSHHTTGEAIKRAAGVPANFKLYGPDGEEVADNQELSVKTHERFIAISGQDVS